MPSWWKDSISIDETKASVLIVIFILSFIGAMFAYGFRGDITDNCLEFLQWLILAIGGVNGVSAVSSAIQSFNESKIK
ncbi:MAG: hypothetical protein PHY30_03625 [Candidatus Pacebacteria bacterium]|nr:hypothetical protein [Candidatus Paceibacterota bacterium]